MPSIPSPDWQLARLTNAGASPTSNDWIHAVVPGAVQLDWARAHSLPNLNYGQNVTAWQGLEDSFWLYRATIPKPRLTHGERLILSGDGLDHRAEFRIRGETLLDHTGVCTPYELDLTEHAGDVLEVLFHPAPRRPGAPPDRAEASHTTKPAVSYGWDWHPRLIPIGFSDEPRFEIRPATYLRHVDFRYVLAEDFSSAAITVSIETSVPCGYVWELRSPEGDIVISSRTPDATLSAPRLWWTHDHGLPELYSLQVSLGTPGSIPYTRSVGFRRVRLVMHEGGWDHPIDFPKSRSHPPITVELNGRHIFGRGTNWVNPDIFPGRITADTYRPLLLLAREAHFNLLRAWGGAAAPKESFFEQCDELGLLVWQEFPLACNDYPDDPAYLNELDRESRSIIRRVRQHPSLALWCGGNELFNSWGGMDDQSLPLRLLNRNCYELDPSSPYLPTSPLDGMAHGDYRFRDTDGRDVFQIFQSASNTAYPEFGCPGLSPLSYLRTFIPEAELWPPAPGTSWETHHAFNAWSSDPNYWSNLTALEHYFGASHSLEQLVARGEWLQCEGYKSIYEEARRQSPTCSLAINWCYNEPWPCAANNSLINFPAIPKPAYYAVQSACRPLLASARIPKFQWATGELFTAELWLLNDSPVAQPAGELVANLIIDGNVTELLRWTLPELPPQRNLPGPFVRIAIPATNCREFTLALSVPERPGLGSSYRLSLKQTDQVASSGSRALNN
jgi:beta-mannosidase